MNQTIPPPAALRKMAILISTLDPLSADALLEKMPAQIADIVRQIVPDLENVDAEECDEVIHEFMLAGGQSVSSVSDGVELDASLRSKISSPNGYPEHNGVQAASEPLPAPFSFLREAAGESVARHLARQHPQVIAVVAAHLPPAQAADVIKHLSPKLQADVLRRVAELDAADQEIVRDIERELESLLSDELRIARNRQTGLTTVRTILNAAGKEKNVLLESLTEHEHGLAAELRTGKRTFTGAQPSLASRRPVVPKSTLPTEPQSQPLHSEMNSSNSEDPAIVAPPHQSQPTEVSGGEPTVPPTESTTDFDFTFEDLASFGDEDWATLIRSTEPQIVLLALTGASDQLLKRITQRLAKTEAQALRNKLHHSGPLRLSDIEKAQRHVAHLASQLVARGLIQLPERRGFAAAA